MFDKTNFDAAKAKMVFSSLTEEKIKDVISPGTQHAEAVWDPAESQPLARAVVLSPGRWQVSLTSIPIEFERAPFSNAAWSVLCASTPPKSGESQRIDLDQWTTRALFAANAEAQNQDDPCTSSKGWRAVPIRFGLRQKEAPSQLLLAFGTKGEAQTPLGSVPRSFGVDVEAIAGDAIQAVADVAVVRAQQATLSVARDTIVKRVCDEWVPELNRVLAHRVAFSGQLFAQTCEVLRALNPSSLSTLGGSLRAALTNDAVDLITSYLSDRFLRCLVAPEAACENIKPIPGAAGWAPVLAAVTGVVAAGVFESDSALPRAQAAVTQFVREQESSGASGGVRLAMTVLAYCHQAGTCDSHTLRTVLESPSKYINVDQQLERSAEYKNNLGEYVSLVAHALSLMSPKRADTPKTHALNVLRFTRGLVRVLGREAACSTQADCQRSVQELNRALDVLFAVAEGDSVRIIAFAGAVVARAVGGDEADAGVRSLAALAAFAETYNASTANMNQEQLRQRRAEAVSALADIAAARELRVGDWAIAAGAWVGPRGGVQWSFENAVPAGPDAPAPASATPSAAFQVSLPIGLLIEHRLGAHHGLWFGVSALDAAAYTTFTLASNGTPETPRPSPLAAVSLGGAAGYLFLDNFVVAADIRFQPWATTASNSPALDNSPRRLSFGLSLSYQLPLFWVK
ncbi:MAG: hypothetical protein ACOZQL_07580 [Myxococcota bacterium]